MQATCDSRCGRGDARAICTVAAELRSFCLICRPSAQLLPNLKINDAFFEYRFAYFIVPTIMFLITQECPEGNYNKLMKMPQIPDPDQNRICRLLSRANDE